jgi:hypothetical protein
MVNFNLVKGGFTIGGLWWHTILAHGIHLNEACLRGLLYPLWSATKWPNLVKLDKVNNEDSFDIVFPN